MDADVKELLLGKLREFLRQARRNVEYCGSEEEEASRKVKIYQEEVDRYQRAVEEIEKL